MAVLEGVMGMLGMGISNLLDNLLPDLELDANLDGADAGSTAALSQLLGWVGLGKVPAAIWLLCFLTLFGLTGIVLQTLSQRFFGAPLSPWLALLPALAISLPLVRLTTRALSKFAMKDETQAISRDSLVGHLATITVGEAAIGSPAEARLTDHFGTTHYIMVEPCDTETYAQGTQVLVIEKRGAIFRAVLPDELP